jgi:hypothetical protein
MVWIVVGIIVFVCVFLLVARIHVAKGKKHEEAADFSDVEADSEADSGE